MKAARAARAAKAAAKAAAKGPAPGVTTTRVQFKSEDALRGVAEE